MGGPKCVTDVNSRVILLFHSFVKVYERDYFRTQEFRAPSLDSSGYDGLFIQRQSEGRGIPLGSCPLGSGPTSGPGSG